MVEASPLSFDAGGLDWYADMANGNVEEFRAAERGEQAVRAVVQPEAEGILERLDGDPASCWAQATSWRTPTSPPCPM